MKNHKLLKKKILICIRVEVYKKLLVSMKPKTGLFGGVRKVCEKFNDFVSNFALNTVCSWCKNLSIELRLIFYRNFFESLIKISWNWNFSAFVHFLTKSGSEKCQLPAIFLRICNFRISAIVSFNSHLLLRFQIIWSDCNCGWFFSLKVLMIYETGLIAKNFFLDLISK